MPRLQDDEQLAALVRVINDLKIPAFLGDEKELDALVTSKMETGFGEKTFSNICSMKWRGETDYTAIPYFTLHGVRRTLGRHPLALACYVADLYNIEIIDKFIKPVGTVTNRAMLNLHWEADHLNWIKHEETSAVFVEGLVAWFKTHNGLVRQVGPRVRKTADENAQQRWARRSQFGSQALATLARFEDLVAKMEEERKVDRELVSTLDGRLRGAYSRLSEVADSQDTRLAKLESLLTALCKAVVSPLPLGGGEDYTSPRCLLCKNSLPEPGSDHCARCQPGLVIPGAL